MQKNIEDIFDDPISISSSVMKILDNRSEGSFDLTIDSVPESFRRDVLFQSTYENTNVENNDEVGRVLAAWLKKKKRLNVIQWEPNKEQYPKFMLLGTDKGILAYIEPFYHSSCENAEVEMIAKYGICHRMKDMRERLALVDSDLDRPVFYVHVLNYPSVKGVFFETTEMIKINIYEEDECVDKNSSGEYYFSDLCEMGDIEELVMMFDDLKKNNVKFN